MKAVSTAQSDGGPAFANAGNTNSNIQNVAGDVVQQLPAGSLLVRWGEISNTWAPVIVENVGDGWAYAVDVQWQIPETPEDLRDRPPVWQDIEQGVLGDISRGSSRQIGKRMRASVTWQATVTVAWSDEDGRRREQKARLDQP